MAQHQYFLKDKKIEIWKGESKYVSGVKQTTYSLLYPSLWAYYRQLGGSSTITGSNASIKVYDTTERAIFVINRLPQLRKETLSLLKIRFRGRVYDLELIDDYEGYNQDYKITAKYSSTQKYTGMPEDE